MSGKLALEEAVDYRTINYVIIECLRKNVQNLRVLQ